MKTSQTEHFEVFENHALAVKFEALSALQEGWLDGAGAVPPKEELAQLSDQLVASFPSTLPLPFVCLTPEGHVFLEWTVGDHCVTAEISLPAFETELQVMNTATGAAEEEQTELKGPDGFARLYAFAGRFA